MTAALRAIVAVLAIVSPAERGPFAPAERLPRPSRPASGPETPGAGGRPIGAYRVTCYGPPDFPAGQRTATGRPVGPGIAAVDPARIRLGSTIAVAGVGTYLAADTGGAIRGAHVDVWRPDCSRWPNPTAQITLEETP